MISSPATGANVHKPAVGIRRIDVPAASPDGPEAGFDPHCSCSEPMTLAGPVPAPGTACRRPMADRDHATPTVDRKSHGAWRGNRRALRRQLAKGATRR